VGENGERGGFQMDTLKSAVVGAAKKERERTQRRTNWGSVGPGAGLREPKDRRWSVREVIRGDQRKVARS
jgi:hypothetical protein